MFKVYDETPSSPLPPISLKELSDEEVLGELHELKRELKDKVYTLCHYYQNDEVYTFADETGDSLALAQKARKVKHPYIIFCGVHFMAETADMLTSAEQRVLLPDLNAGCTMADMANHEQVQRCWSELTRACDEKTFIPVTYINCDAKLKAFVGDHGGYICTSSNASAVIRKAFERGEKLLFFPDQHLGRNTCYEMGIPLEEMVTYDPTQKEGGLPPQEIQKARVILWYGLCSVHQGFRPEHIKALKQENPDVQVVVHPECSFDVVQGADHSGSTSFIMNYVANAKAGSHIAIGTEVNLVNRLARLNPDKKIQSLSPYQCLCTTMYRIRPRWLLQSFRSIKEGRPENIIRVPRHITNSSLVALDRMFEVSK